MIFIETQKHYYVFDSKGFFFHFFNVYNHNVVSTWRDVIQINVKNDKVVSTLPNVVQINVETNNGVANSNVGIHNVDSNKGLQVC